MDVVFDIENSISLEGDSGPYIQYTYARAKSVLRKSKDCHPELGSGSPANAGISHSGEMLKQVQHDTTLEELSILRWLYRFPEVVELVAKNYSPNLVCTYLFELAKRFNNLYNNCPILENNFRLALTEAVSRVLKNGLNLLGIEALERM